MSRVMRGDDSHAEKGATQRADAVVLILDFMGRPFRSKGDDGCNAEGRGRMTSQSQS